MVRSEWIVADGFGKRWRLWRATGPEAETLSADEARNAIRSLVGASLEPEARGAATLIEIHNALTGDRLSPRDFTQGDLGTVRRLSRSVADSLEWAAQSKNLCIERVVPRALPVVIAEIAPEVVVVPVAAPLGLAARVHNKLVAAWQSFRGMFRRRLAA